MTWGVTELDISGAVMKILSFKQQASQDRQIRLGVYLSCKYKRFARSASRVISVSEKSFAKRLFGIVPITNTGGLVE